MPPGFGSSPFGSGPYGFGEPSGSAPVRAKVYFDASTGTQLTGRKIDPGSRQYVFGDDGSITGQATVPQLVQLAYSTVKGSSILADLGEDFREIQVIGDGFVALVTAKAIEPVQALIDQKKLAIRSVDVQRIADSSVSIAVNWLDLTSNIQGTQNL